MRSFLPIALLIGLAGCNGNESAVTTNSPASSPATSAPPTGPARSPMAVASSEVPAALRNDAYVYYGLGNTNPLPLEMEQTSGKGPATTTTGEVVTKLEKVQGDSATFHVTYNGDLASTLGTNEFVLKKDGLHAISTGEGQVTGDNLELPAKLTPGSTWRTKNSINSHGQSVQQDITFKIVGMQKAETKAKTYDQALYITGSGSMTQTRKKMGIEARAWYVPNVGAVRTELSLQTNPPTKIVIQERKAS